MPCRGGSRRGIQAAKRAAMAIIDGCASGIGELPSGLCREGSTEARGLEEEDEEWDICQTWWSQRRNDIGNH